MAKTAKKAKKSEFPVVPAKDTAANRFLALIGEEGLRDALSSSADPRASDLMDMLFDPAFANKSFGELRADAGLTMADLVGMFRDRKIAEGIVKIAQMTPELLADVVEDARSRSAPCKGCKGFGIITDGEGSSTECKHCKGSGIVRVPGDSESRKLVFETLGLTSKRGPLVQVNTQNNITPGNAGLPQVGAIVRQTDHLLEGRVMEAEIVEGK